MHTLHSVFATTERTFVAYPVVDGAAQDPGAREGLAHVGVFLSFLVPHDWIERGARDCEAAFAKRVASVQSVFDAGAKAERAKLTAATEKARAARRPKRTGK